ncbi:cellulose synthase subunit BcsC-related outer membrane protein [Shigella flexneri]
MPAASRRTKITPNKSSGHPTRPDLLTVRQNSVRKRRSIAIGWKNDTWRCRHRDHPDGLRLVLTWLVAASYSSDIGPLGYTVNAHRRPISSSLLAFGGQKDKPAAVRIRVPPGRRTR